MATHDNEKNPRSASSRPSFCKRVNNKAPVSLRDASGCHNPMLMSLSANVTSPPTTNTDNGSSNTGKDSNNSENTNRNNVSNEKNQEAENPKIMTSIDTGSDTHDSNDNDNDNDNDNNKVVTVTKDSNKEDEETASTTNSSQKDNRKGRKRQKAVPRKRKRQRDPDEAEEDFIFGGTSPSESWQISSSDREAKALDNGSNFTSVSLCQKNKNFYEDTIRQLDKWSQELLELKGKLEGARLNNAVLLNKLHEIGAIREECN